MNEAQSDWRRSTSPVTPLQQCPPGIPLLEWCVHLWRTWCPSQGRRGGGYRWWMWALTGTESMQWSRRLSSHPCCQRDNWLNTVKPPQDPSSFQTRREGNMWEALICGWSQKTFEYLLDIEQLWIFLYSVKTFILLFPPNTDYSMYIFMEMFKSKLFCGLS